MLKVDWQGKLTCKDGSGRSAGRFRRVGAGGAVELNRRLQVYYCNTLIREIDPAAQRSTIVARWLSSPTQDQKL